MLCRQCKEKIPNEAKICASCGSHQNRGLYYGIIAAQLVGLVSLVAASASFFVPWIADLFWSADRVEFLGFNGRQALLANVGDTEVVVVSVKFEREIPTTINRIKREQKGYLLGVTLRPGEVRQVDLGTEEPQLQVVGGFIDIEVMDQLRALSLSELPTQCVFPKFFSPTDGMFRDSLEDSGSSRELIGIATIYSVNRGKFVDLKLPFLEMLVVADTSECLPVRRYLACAQARKNQSESGCIFSPPMKWVEDTPDELRGLLCKTNRELCKSHGLLN